MANNTHRVAVSDSPTSVDDLVAGVNSKRVYYFFHWVLNRFGMLGA